jgi:hypothetical protein
VYQGGSECAECDVCTRVVLSVASVMYVPGCGVWCEDRGDNGGPHAGEPLRLRRNLWHRAQPLRGSGETYAQLTLLSMAVMCQKLDHTAQHGSHVPEAGSVQFLCRFYAGTMQVLYGHCFPN